MQQIKNWKRMKLTNKNACWLIVLKNFEGKRKGGDFHKKADDFSVYLILLRATLLY